MHALHQKIGVHFIYPPLEDEQIVRNGLVLTHISPSQDEMIKAMLIYRFANQIRSVIDNPKIFRAVSKDMTQKFKETVLPSWWANTETLRSDFRARLAELKLKPGMRCNSGPISDLNLPSGVLIGAVKRGDGIFVPRGNDHLAAGDTIMLLQQRRNRRFSRAFFLDSGEPYQLSDAGTATQNGA